MVTVVPYSRLKSPPPSLGSQSGLMTMRAVPYPVASPSYYNYPISMAAMYSGVPFPMPQISPAVLLTQSTRQVPSVTSVDPTSVAGVSSVVTAAPSVSDFVTTHHNSGSYVAPQGHTNYIIQSPRMMSNTQRFDPYGVGLMAPTVAKSPESIALVVKTESTVKAENNCIMEAGTVIQNPDVTQGSSNQVDTQLNQPLMESNQNMKKRNEVWISNAALNNAYASEPPQHWTSSLCQTGNQVPAGPSYRESYLDVKEKLLPGLYGKTFQPGYVPSGTFIYDASPRDKLYVGQASAGSATTNTTTKVVTNTTTTSFSSPSSVSSSPSPCSPFSSTASTSVTSNTTVSTTLINPLTLLAETEECDTDGLPAVDDTDESELSALDLVMLTQPDQPTKMDRERVDWE